MIQRCHYMAIIAMIYFRCWLLPLLSIRCQLLLMLPCHSPVIDAASWPLRCIAGQAEVIDTLSISTLFLFRRYFHCFHICCHCITLYCRRHSILRLCWAATFYFRYAAADAAEDTRCQIISAATLRRSLILAAGQRQLIDIGRGYELTPPASLRHNIARFTAITPADDADTPLSYAWFSDWPLHITLLAHYTILAFTGQLWLHIISLHITHAAIHITQMIIHIAFSWATPILRHYLLATFIWFFPLCHFHSQ